MNENWDDDIRVIDLIIFLSSSNNLNLKFVEDTIPTLSSYSDNDINFKKFWNLKLAFKYELDLETFIFKLIILK